MHSSVRAWSGGLLAVAVLCAVYGCSGPKVDWAECLTAANNSVEGYRKLHASATARVHELPAPGNDAAVIANHKVLNDALAMVAAETATFAATVSATRSSVEAALAGADAATAARDGCAKLTAESQQAAAKIATSATAVQLYNNMVTKARQ